MRMYNVRALTILKTPTTLLAKMNCNSAAHRTKRVSVYNIASDQPYHDGRCSKDRFIMVIRAHDILVNSVELEADPQ